MVNNFARWLAFFSIRSSSSVGLVLGISTELIIRDLGDFGLVFVISGISTEFIIRDFLILNFPQGANWWASPCNSPS